MNKYQEALEFVILWVKCSGETKGVDSSIKTLQELVDKETPKKVEILEDFDERGISYKTYLCGMCQNVLSNTNSRYCPNCGTKFEVKE